MVALLFSVLTAINANAAIVYTVKAKDTLWKISKENNVSMDALLKANPDLKDEKNLEAGKAIMIPDEDEEVIPLDSESSSTHTLIVHGSGSQYQTPMEKNVNIMTVDGKTIKVPTYQLHNKKKAAPRRSSSYRYKYGNMSSRTYRGGSAIVKTAFSYMGVPYVFGGSTPNGFDCSGFVQYVFARNGIKTPRMAHHQFYAGTPISKSQLRPGDLVFFETYTRGISHVGIYIGNNNFIHASSSGAVKINCLGEAYYTNRYRGAARY